MSESTAIKTVTVINPEGLHLRPLDAFVKLAQKFESKVEIVKDGERVDGKSILDILTLAVEKGTQLSIEANGADAEAAAAALVDLVRHGFTQQETSNQQETGDNGPVG